MRLTCPTWLLPVLAVASGCGILTWKAIYSCPRPGIKGAVRVEEMCGLADCNVRIVVTDRWLDTPVTQRRGCVVMFAHAAWLGNLVAIFVDGGYCGTIKAAYDVQAHRAVDFTSVEPWLKQAIVRDYHVTPDSIVRLLGDRRSLPPESLEDSDAHLHCLGGALAFVGAPRVLRRLKTPRCFGAGSWPVSIASSPLAADCRGERRLIGQSLFQNLAPS
jgi:hypothetical protein